ncbi:MAG: hypothetical protein WC696_12735, partial [Candidatus Methylopumilus sp.]
RVWTDGSGEVIAKFQYMLDAESFAAAKAAKDAETKPDCSHFYLAVCEAENALQAFRPSTVTSQEPL